MKSPKRKQLPIGASDFRKLREDDCYYVDKSLFIREITETPAEVILLPRPRRFGKTLNLSMLRYFFENTDEDRKYLFNGLAIRNNECFDMYCGKYPVIWLTFKDLKEASWKDLYRHFTNLIRDEFLRHEFLLRKGVLHLCDQTESRTPGL